MDTSKEATRAFSVLDFGAVGDGKTLNSQAIQSAIDTCASKSGGIVFFPPGQYLTGTIELKNNVALELATEACLLGSTDLADYPAQEQTPYESRCLVYAFQAHHVALQGQGTIDGQGSAFPCGAEGFNFEDETGAPSTQTFIRPLLVRFVKCEEVDIRDLTLQHSAFWCCHIKNCKGVRLNGVHVFNRANQNNDGFDITDCEDVFASNCKINCGDDAFALQGGGRNIVITNCLISTRWAAFRMGPDARGIYRDICVSNCVVYDTYGSAIKLQEVEGGVMENILFDNIIMENVTGPISIRLGGYLGWKHDRKESFPIGTFRNVQFSNIRAKVADNAYPLAHEVPPFPGEQKSCINITGIPGYYVENVSMSNIHITFPGGGTVEDATIAVPELRDHYPEYHMFGTLPAYGLYVRHARGIVLNNITFDYAGIEKRPALVCDDVVDLELGDFRASVDQDGLAMIVLRNTQQAFIHGCRPLQPVRTFIRLEGAESQEILLTGNDLHKVGRSVELAGGATNAAVLPEAEW